jgi:hypothetical protein
MAPDNDANIRGAAVPRHSTIVEYAHLPRALAQTGCHHGSGNDLTPSTAAHPQHIYVLQVFSVV